VDSFSLQLSTGHGILITVKKFLLSQICLQILATKNGMALQGMPNSACGAYFILWNNICVNLSRLDTYLLLRFMGYLSLLMEIHMKVEFSNSVLLKNTRFTHDFLKVKYMCRLNHFKRIIIY